MARLCRGVNSGTTDRMVSHDSPGQPPPQPTEDFTAIAMRSARSPKGLAQIDWPVAFLRQSSFLADNGYFDCDDASRSREHG